MSDSYAELLDGATLVRRPPGQRHELICGRLHNCVRAGVANFSSTVLLAPRAAVTLSPSTSLRPDLALITVATGKLWLAAEIVSSDDHRTDTVLKKQLYEEARLPRLWMIDPRYDNVEVYHGTPYGLSLKHILSIRETLTEPLLPEFELSVSELFSSPA